jgi:hypothetical protein
MATILLSAIIFVLSAGGLAIGLLFGREPLSGACGRCTCAGGDRTGERTTGAAQ